MRIMKRLLEALKKEKEIAKTKDILEDGKKVITKRLKMIRLADREDWMTVNEYLSDDLASDSADEKAISKAIKAAASKKEKKRKLKAKKLSSL